MTKLLIGTGTLLGTTLGSYIPVFWGGSLLSLTSIFFSVMGGIVGIWIGYRLSKLLGFM